MTIAQETLKPYQQAETSPPDPSFLFQLPNEVRSSSNLFAVQKTFDGEFQFDIFFESSSTNQGLDGIVVSLIINLHSFSDITD